MEYNSSARFQEAVRNLVQGVRDPKKLQAFFSIVLNGIDLLKVKGFIAKGVYKDLRAETAILFRDALYSSFDAQGIPLDRCELLHDGIYSIHISYLEDGNSIDYILSEKATAA